MKCEREIWPKEMAKGMEVDGEKYNIIDRIYYVGDTLIIEKAWRERWMQQQQQDWGVFGRTLAPLITMSKAPHLRTKGLPFMLLIELNTCSVQGYSVFWLDGQRFVYSHDYLTVLPHCIQTYNIIQITHAYLPHIYTLKTTCHTAYIPDLPHIFLGNFWGDTTYWIVIHYWFHSNDKKWCLTKITFPCVALEI